MMTKQSLVAKKVAKENQEKARKAHEAEREKTMAGLRAQSKTEHEFKADCNKLVEDFFKASGKPLLDFCVKHNKSISGLNLLEILALVLR